MIATPNAAVLATISTHAPAGGATRPALRRGRRGRISTHAPAGGATETVGDILNPMSISTHAPAGGATGSPCRPPRLPKNFYSRPCGRGDVSNSDTVEVLPEFLLTPLREGRRKIREVCVRIVFRISTHAPAGGATQRMTALFRMALFLLTPLREGRLQFSTSPS